MELMIAAFGLVRGVMSVEMNNQTSIKLRRGDMFFSSEQLLWDTNRGVGKI
jgi:hypothetical protein